jgi:hypothetical protein
MLLKRKSFFKIKKCCSKKDSYDNFGTNELKGQGHDFRICYKWDVLIDLNSHRVRQLFNIFLNSSFS